MQYDVNAIIQGYAVGYFLMANDGEHSLEWYSSRERALIPLDQRFRYPSSLQRVLNQNRFTVAINRDFTSVVEGCANREETWISSELKEIYHALNEAGFAYSFETWQGDELAGGILGIVIGGAFIGESMFFRIPDGSKVAMVKLVERLRQKEFILFDAQMNNPHLERFGSYIIKNKEYKTILKKAINQPCSLK
ncbi:MULTISPECIES: leucyl/phenylalanyl-tRNA--protein transferase [Planktothrix]|jgi:leucyl/phenylalanyl-tRNA--protein transferase|uniref:Leucyl/phenylalanyl-tRNA--protein transferase n=2 Tax=Planktothrix TaxID=54304 RepID=A0A4P5ZBA6_PLAAG|nr:MULTISPECIES: leucyl/phenylalanyl-tRNA--protein transferase [Planktothrix]CAD5976537.1 Leucyl/phenylalanyl-tRNA--protein transferase [Planktothrix rubescens]MBG0747193.1 leucyl/phenylalanyl-tRNA--protein transferase [Planktothrix agardhii KL2]CAC5344853.1 Leucyl/phenylalanyl-tRNA--protein transferase [Planktothrix rubescens NIVA-CYA 18]CAD0232094.1 Leucyl/phenylalanyl-tRNA--protein transferase [Planktothrix agardhii]CAD5968118.1 Leucyl/phenylalanyl-tRNA--protein transferase [Planktothrix ru